MEHYIFEWRLGRNFPWLLKLLSQSSLTGFFRLWNKARILVTKVLNKWIIIIIITIIIIIIIISKTIPGRNSSLSALGSERIRRCRFFCHPLGAQPSPRKEDFFTRNEEHPSLKRVWSTQYFWPRVKKKTHKITSNCTDLGPAISR